MRQASGEIVLLGALYTRYPIMLPDQIAQPGGRTSELPRTRVKHQID